MKSQATRNNIPTVGIRPASQPEAEADTVPARRHYSNLVSVTVASSIIAAAGATIIIAAAGIVMAYAGLGLAMWPG